MDSTDRQTTAVRIAVVGIVVAGVLILGLLAGYSVWRYLVPAGTADGGLPTIASAQATQASDVTLSPPESPTLGPATPMGGETATASPDAAATATAACALFEQQFPGTPCPAAPAAAIEATATAACATFESQFPGTPCP